VSCRTWRHLAAKVGTVRTTEGKHNKPSGCSASGAHAPGPAYEEEEEEGNSLSNILQQIR